MQVHEETCDMVVIDCIYGCSKRLARGKMRAHRWHCTAMFDGANAIWPVCDGYCQRRKYTPLQIREHDLVAGKYDRRPFSRENPEMPDVQLAPMVLKTPPNAQEIP